jgi:hypothetical protein
MTPGMVEASLAGTPEGAMVAAAQQGDGEPASLASTLGAARDDLNPSPAAEAAATVVPPPTKDPVGIATGAGNVTLNTGTVNVKVGLPNLLP